MIARLLLALVTAPTQPTRPAAMVVDSPPARATVMSSGHPMAVWSRRPLHPRGTVLLVHGRTWSALPDFDLHVPGESRSIMMALAARGYVAYAVDLRGYGATPRDRSGWDTPAQAEEDVAAVLRWIVKTHPDDPAPALLGWSNGSMVAQLVAQRHPALITRLILYGYPHDAAMVIDSDQLSPHPLRVRTTAADARSDFISPAVTSTRMEDVYVLAALRSDPVRTDWRGLTQWNGLLASQVHVPTLLLQGEHDPSVSHESLATFFAALGTTHKEWITLLHGDHAALLEDTTPGFVDAVLHFLDDSTAH